MKFYNIIIVFLLGLNIEIVGQNALAFLDSISDKLNHSVNSNNEKVKLMLGMETVTRYALPSRYGQYLDSITSIISKDKGLKKTLLIEYLILKASIERRNGKFDQALTNILEAKQLAENDQDTLLLIRCLTGISTLNNKLTSLNRKGIFQTALDYSAQAHYLAIKINDPVSICIALQMHSANLMTANRDNEAFKLLIGNNLTIAKIQDKTLKNIYLAYNYCLLGLCSPTIKLSENNLLKSLAISEENGLKYITSLACHNIAHKVFIPTRQFGKAEDYLIKSLNVIEIPKEKLPTYKALIEVVAEAKDSARALVYALKYLNLKDSLEKVFINEEFVELETKYKLSQKESTILKLQLSNEMKNEERKILLYILGLTGIFLIITIIFAIVLSKTKRKLQQAIHTKELIFSLVSHDIRSPILGLLYAVPSIKDSVRKVDSSHTDNLLDVLQNKIVDLHFLTENVFYWSCLQQDKKANFTSFNVINEIQLLIDHYLPKLSIKEISHDVVSELDNNILIYDRMIFITVLRNVLDNAIKYTPVGGAIEIRLIKIENRIQIHVVDSGPGISDELAENIFQFKYINTLDGENSTSGSGIGLSICKEILKVSGDNIYCISGGCGHFVIEILIR